MKQDKDIITGINGKISDVTIERHSLPPMDLRLPNNNPRTITNDRFMSLVDSIKEAPHLLELRPPICDEGLMVLAGCQRTKAAIAAGLEMISVYVVKGLTRAQKREILIRDNVSSGKWDFDELANSWDFEELKKWGVDLPLFDEPKPIVIPKDFMTIVVKDRDGKVWERKVIQTIGDANPNGHIIIGMLEAFEAYEVSEMLTESPLPNTMDHNKKYHVKIEIKELQ